MEVLGDHSKKESPLRGRGARFFQRNPFKNELREKSAFTLIEVLVVVAIAAIVSTGGFVMFSKYRSSQNLRLTLGELVAVIRDTQKRSITQENGKAWGLRLSSGDTDSFKVWSGQSYASGTIDQTYSLRRGVRFGNPHLGQTVDVVLSALSGVLDAKKVITLYSGSDGILAGDVVINTLGKTTVRVEDGLAGYWHFDEGASSTIYDASGRGSTGTFLSVPTWVSYPNCKAGACALFNGSGTYGKFGSGESLNFQTGDFSVVAWFKVNDYTALSGEKSLINKYSGSYDGWRWEFSGAYLKFSAGDGGGSFDVSGNFTNAINSNNWYLAAIVVNRADSKVYGYLNGVSNGSLNISTTTDWDTASELYVGKQSWAEIYSPAGVFDEVRIYRRALTAEEITNIYNDLK